MEELRNGVYTVEVSLGGGSGRAKIENPAELTAGDGELKAKICWDSPYYDYMEVEGKEYYPVNKEGNSVFVIDARLDRELAAKAETVAMSRPHTIDYTLYFDSASLRRENGAMPFAAIVAAIAAAAAALMLVKLIKKRKRNEK